MLEILKKYSYAMFTMFYLFVVLFKGLFDQFTVKHVVIYQEVKFSVYKLR